MIALIQRVSSASVVVDGNKISEIGKGFLVLLGVFEKDTHDQVELLAKKTANLRIFEDSDGRMNISPAMLQQNGEKCEILVVSQFTLCAQCKGQNRPAFISAAKPQEAQSLYEDYVKLLRQSYSLEVCTGEFGADMKVELLNDGPVTIILDTDKL